jgi:hypothetical protein
MKGKSNFHIYTIGGVVSEFAYFLLFVGIGVSDFLSYYFAVL